MTKSLKKNCNNCRARTEEGCALGYACQNNIPTEACLKPQTIAEFETARRIRNGEALPAEAATTEPETAPQKTYLVDTENIGRTFIPMLMNPEPNASYIMFCSEHSPMLPLSTLPKIKANLEVFQFIECCTPGQNALDFQLISVMGYLLHKTPKNQYIVVSKDTGYDPAIRFWKQHGFDIKRFEPSEPPAEHIAKKNPTKENIAKALREANVNSIYIDNMTEIIFGHKKNKSAIYQEFIKQFGQEHGTTLYKNNKAIINVLCR